MIYQLQVERERMHLSLEDVAEKCGIDAETLSYYEHFPWAVPTDILRKLSKIYAVSPYGLVGNIAEFDWVNDLEKQYRLAKRLD